MCRKVVAGDLRVKKAGERMLEKEMLSDGGLRKGNALKVAGDCSNQVCRRRRKKESRRVEEEGLKFLCYLWRGECGWWGRRWAAGKHKKISQRKVGQAFLKFSAAPCRMARIHWVPLYCRASTVSVAPPLKPRLKFTRAHYYHAASRSLIHCFLTIPCFVTVDFQLSHLRTITVIE